ncbi:MAG: ABC transporter ATP-binding protein [Rhodospirillaceae bacterium]|nr:ABC transporter ATP-binding protein [Rhodospirillaceae bacterium]
MLSVEGLVAGYQAGSRVLQGLSLEVHEGETVALMGRNGMGKTTFLRTLMGHLRASAGRIRFAGRDILGLRPFEISNLGVAYVPQGREVFRDFTVQENLILGVLGKPGLPARVDERLYEWFPILTERRQQKAGTLSGGEQQQLAIARALAGRPRLLLLDEPSEGIQPSIVQAIADTVRAIAEAEGLTVLLVEQNLDLVLGMAERCLFIENGVIAESAPVGELRRSPALLDRYLSV